MIFLINKKTLNKQIKAFSLIELSIVLIVIGIIAGAVFKGHDLLENAKIRATINELQNISLSTSIYEETYNALPGDDINASKNFIDVKSGNGDGKINSQDSELFFKHLYKAGIYQYDENPPCKLGGYYSIISDVSDNMKDTYILISNNGNGALTPKQAFAIKNKMDGTKNTNPTSGNVIIKDGNNSIGLCIKNNAVNLDNKNADCVIYYKLK